MQATMMNAITAAGISTLAAFGFVSGVGIVETATSLTGPPPARSMQLVDLHYSDGVVTQTIAVQGGPVTATWGAEVVRGNVQLCSGGGLAPYEGKTVSMDIDRWTGDECPPLHNGDTLRATWEYKTSEGYVVSITGTAMVE